MIRKGVRRYLLLVAALVGFFAAYGVLLYSHFQALWRRPEYQFFPFLLLAVGYLFCRAWFSEPTSTERPMPLSAVIGVCSVAWLLLALAIRMHSAWWASVSLVLCVAAVIGIVSRSRSVAGLWPVWLLLWLIVPVPLRLDRPLILYLQTGCSWISSQLLDYWGIDHLLRGNVLDLSGHQLLISEACSGIVSMISVIAAAAVITVWAGQGVLHGLLLMATGVYWAFLANCGRIVTIVAALDWFSVDLSVGWLHALLGTVVFGITMCLLICTHRFLAYLLQPIDVQNIRSIPFHDYDWPLPQENRSIKTWNAVVSFGSVRLDAPRSFFHRATRFRFPRARRSTTTVAVGLMFGILSVWQFASFSLGYDWEEPIQRAIGLESRLLPARIGDWRRADTVSSSGGQQQGLARYSNTYHFRQPLMGLAAVVSLDFPFEYPWHELTRCYRGTGWTIERRTLKKTGQEKRNAPWAHGQWDWVEAELEWPNGQRGFLLFCMFNADGDLMSAPASEFHYALGKLKKRRRQLLAPLFQVQVWASSNRSFSEENKESIRSLFLDVRRMLYQRLASHDELPVASDGQFETRA